MDARSSSSTAAAPAATNGATAAHAVTMSGKIIIEVRRWLSSGTVANTASAMNPSVPSDPTISRWRICTGVSASRNEFME